MPASALAAAARLARSPNGAAPPPAVNMKLSGGLWSAWEARLRIQPEKSDRRRTKSPVSRQGCPPSTCASEHFAKLKLQQSAGRIAVGCLVDQRGATARVTNGLPGITKVGDQQTEACSFQPRCRWYQALPFGKEAEIYRRQRGEAQNDRRISARQVYEALALVLAAQLNTKPTRGIFGAKINFMPRPFAPVKAKGITRE